jgi:hypothetical protein
MKILISETYLGNLLKSEKKRKSELELSLDNLIKKNNKIYISIETIKNTLNDFSFSNSEKIIQNLEIICDTILQFNLEIYKLSLNFKNSQIEYPNERAIASFYGLDRILDGNGTLVPIIGFRSESDHD